MKAIVRTKAGKELNSMQVMDLSLPAAIKKSEIKVKMHSSRINPVDVDLMKGMPFLKYKKPQIGGIDGAGTITDIGEKVQGFSVGDNVYFYRLFTDIGTWAEQIVVDAKHVAKTPSNLSLTEVGSISLPLLTAYDALRQLQAKRGNKVLIHGAGGGVGFAATQLAIKMGLEVVVTCGPNDIEWLTKAGASQIIDYKKQSFESVIEPGSLDYVLDTLGKEVLLKSIALKPQKVVSLHFIDPSKMANTGIKLPSFLRPIIRLSMRKFSARAKKHGVELIAQITGANGQLLSQASEMVEQIDWLTKPTKTVTLSQIESSGLNKKNVGNTILFE